MLNISLASTEEIYRTYIQLSWFQHVYIYTITTCFQQLTSNLHKNMGTRKGLR